MLKYIIRVHELNIYLFFSPLVTATKCLWICSTWQRSWCLATGCPSSIPTFTRSSTWPSAATAPTAAVKTQTRGRLSRLSWLPLRDRSRSFAQLDSFCDRCVSEQVAITRHTMSQCYELKHAGHQVDIPENIQNIH